MRLEYEVTQYDAMMLPLPRLGVTDKNWDYPDRVCRAVHFIPKLATLSGWYFEDTYHGKSLIVTYDYDDKIKWQVRKKYKQRNFRRWRRWRGEHSEHVRVLFACSW